MAYIDEVLEAVRKQNAEQPEFIQTVEEVLGSLRPVIAQNEELYRREALLERLVCPERCILFRVPWVDDQGNIKVNTATVCSLTLPLVLIRVACVSILP